MSEQLILAIRRARLAQVLGCGEELWNGFRPIGPGDLIPILAACELVPRGPAEEDPGFKQIIPYAVLQLHPERYGPLESVACYRRGKAGQESRLHDRLSLGVGGHVDAEDLGAGGPISGAYYRALDRELNEEVKYTPDPLVPANVPVGLVNEEETAVGSVHLGVVHRVRVYPLRPYVSSREDALRYLGLVDLRFLPAIAHHFELWSQFVIRQLLGESEVNSDGHAAVPEGR